MTNQKCALCKHWTRLCSHCGDGFCENEESEIGQWAKAQGADVDPRAYITQWWDGKKCKVFEGKGSK